MMEKRIMNPWEQLIACRRLHFIRQRSPLYQGQATEYVTEHFQRDWADLPSYHIHPFMQHSLLFALSDRRPQRQWQSSCNLVQPESQSGTTSCISLPLFPSPAPVMWPWAPRTAAVLQRQRRGSLSAPGQFLILTPFYKRKCRTHVFFCFKDKAMVWPLQNPSPSRDSFYLHLHVRAHTHVY